MDQPLKGRTALITGASRGIGRAVALQLHRAGAGVAINYRVGRDAAVDLQQQIQAEGGSALAIQADVSVASEAKLLVETVTAQLAPIDILVNNAGINPPKAIDEITDDDWHETLATNLSSAFFVSQAALPGMRQRRWGRIVMLSSVAAQTGGVIGPHYAASKAGMIGLMHSYANLLAKEGITANAVAPALVETDMIRHLPSVTPDMVPVARYGQASEVADAVLLLAVNGYINGQTLNVNGGWYMS